MKYLILILLLVSCSAQQRVTRIVNKHPELRISDTINFSQLVIRPGRSALLNMPDSVLQRLQPGDSIIAVSKKGVTIIVRKKPLTTEIEASVTGDTVKVDTSLVVPKIKVVQNERVTIWKLRIAYIVSIILLVVVIYLIIKKILKKIIK